MKKLLLVCCLFLSHSLLFAQTEDSPSPIIFIYDASGSMWGKINEKTKMQIASEVLSSSVETLPENQAVGLVAYGHRQKGDCKDVEFLVEARPENKGKVVESLQAIKPKGKTPLAHSAQLVIDNLKSSDTKATIILITDGIESCGGNLCAVIKAAREKGIAFKLHIVGFGLGKDETEELRCAAEAGDGNYYDANDAEGLSEVLNEATSTSVDEPAGNFTIYAVKNGKAIDAHVKVLKPDDKEFFKGVRTHKDTALIYLAAGTYDLEVTPMENSDVAAIKITGLVAYLDSNFHKTVSFDSGKLQVNTMNNGEGWDAVVHVFKKGKTQRVAQGRTYGSPKVYDLNPGKYEIVFKAMTIKGPEIEHRTEEIEVFANETASVEHNFKSGTLKVGASSSEELMDATVHIYDVVTNKHVAQGRTYTSSKNNPKEWIINPGEYEVKMKGVGANSGKTNQFKITVEQGKTAEKIVKF